MRKPVFRGFAQVRQKPGCTTTGDNLRLKISDLESRGIVLSLFENKGTDKLRRNHTADLHLCFCTCKKQVFSCALQLLYIGS